MKNKKLLFQTIFTTILALLIYGPMFLPDSVIYIFKPTGTYVYYTWFSIYMYLFVFIVSYAVGTLGIILGGKIFDYFFNHEEL